MVLRVLLLGVMALILPFMLSGDATADEGVLPQGEVRPALTSAHFPSRMHEFVFRNWNAVAPEKLAALFDTPAENLTAVAVSMGLPAVPVVPPQMMERGYVTIIRRNWHLLPYEQLVALLEMSPERLSVMLREEDFLWIKLGRIKPQCEVLRYHAPTPEDTARAAAIKTIVDADFGAAIAEPGEPRFDFVRQLAAPRPGIVPVQDQQGALPFERIVYSYVSVYGDPLLNPDLNPYPDGLLQRLAAVGINGVWLHAVLRDLAPGGGAFPEFGENHETRIANLRALVDRARRYGVKIYLYINEPRAMPEAFFEARPEIAGVTGTGLRAMCTSHPAVQEWMGGALTHIFREVPGLGGVYAITASENLTNCASHGGWSACPRCKDRSDAEILAEAVRIIEEGVHRGDPNANVLISDWGWRGHGDATEIIPKLPESVWLMSVSEWSLPIERGGISSAVGEYSISAVGPGPRALPHWKLAESLGQKTGAEIQFNNTCEIASLPYLPVMDLVAEHCSNLLGAADLDAMFIGWTMGGYPSPNLHLAQRLSRKPAPTIDTVLDEMALERFGPEGAPLARTAWTQMSNAFREYPFHISVVYTSPVQWGAANPLYGEKTAYGATMWGIPYDDLNGWRGPYPPEVFAAQFEKMAEGWRTGVNAMAAALEKTPVNLREDADGDLRLARAAAIHFQSVANQARFVAARDARAAAGDAATPEDRTRWIGEMRQGLESEITLAKALYELTKEDSRIGFEPSCQYFYLPLDLVEKVINCRWLLAQLDA
ncbi:MAG: hypothetical protein HYV27_14395 [Candidatus Hydrogenedentes bacterium]|nr:hypothetical protein [Candidatus Hydrogenedentota bacterium]